MADAQGKFVAAEPLFDDLPRGWASVRVGDLLPLQYGKALPVRERSEAGNVPVFGSSGIVGSHNQALCPANSILVGRKGSAGSVHFSKAPSWPIDTAYYVTPHRELCAEYWFYQLRFLNLGRLDQSTAIPSLSRDSYSPLSVTVPPAAEQRRIVSRIDELFSRIEVGERAIAAARAGLKRYRKSILKAAVTGALTADWREEHGEPEEDGAALLARIRTREAKRSDGLANLDERFLPEIPETWTWATCATLGAVSGGVTKNANRRDLPVRRPYLRVANVYDNRLDLTEVQEIGLDHGELDRVLLKRNDLLFVEGNGSADQIGRAAIWNEEIAGCVHQNHIIKFRPALGELSKWVMAWMSSGYGREQIEAVASSTSGLHTLSISKIEKLPAPLPPLAEQAEIVSRIEEALSRTDHAEASLNYQSRNARALKQSILKAAFEGRLVPQDPNDEPATDMLARIAGELPASKIKTKARA